MKTLTPKSALDWDVLRSRLAAAGRATADALRVSPDRARQMLDERARSLARSPSAPADAAERIELFAFSLRGERYAFETHYVREVCRPPDATPVPGAPEFLAGVVNLRGEVLAVVDLACALALPASPALAEWLIVLGTGRAEFGIACDEIGEVRTVAVDALHPAVDGRNRYVLGVTAEAVVVLDGAALLADERLTVEE